MRTQHIYKQNPISNATYSIKTYNLVVNFRRIDKNGIKVDGHEFELYLLFTSLNVKNLTCFVLFTNRKFRSSHECVKIIVK